MNTKILCSLAILLISLAVANAAEEENGNCRHPPPKMDLRKCCPTPRLITPEMQETCEKYTENSESTDSSESRPMHANYPCYAQCILNETNIMTPDFEIDQEQLETYLGEIFEEEQDMIPVAEQAFHTCLAKHKKMKAKWLAYKEKHSETTRATFEDDSEEFHYHHHHHHHCCPRSAMFLGCVLGESFVHCAPSVWNDTKRCNDWRDFIKRCHPKCGGRWHKHHRHHHNWHQAVTEEYISSTTDENALSSEN